METKLIHINENGTELTAQEESGLRQAGEIIKSGGLVAFPTETVKHFLSAARAAAQEQ